MLVTCPDCGKQISSQATACPNCGHPGPFAQENIADRAIAPANNETAPDKPMADMPAGLEWDKKTLFANLRRIYFARFLMFANVFVLALIFVFALVVGLLPAETIFLFSVVAIANLITIYFTSRSVVISTYKKSEKYFKVTLSVQMLIVVALIIIAYIDRARNVGYRIAEDLLIIGGLFFTIAILSYALAWICAAVRIKSPALLSSVRKRKSAPGNVGKQKTLEIIGLSAASLLVGFGIWWFYVHLSPDDMRSEGDDYYDSERYSEALRFYEMANEHGALDMFQTHRLGKMYRDGKGVAQDGAKAVEWFRKSVEKGNGYAANDLGVMYMQGKGVAQDYAKAVEWFRKSANETYGYEGKYNLAYMIENGYGVTADVDEALRLYKQLLDSDIPAYYVKDWARKRINAIEERRAEEERQRKLSEIGIALQATIEKFYVGDPVYMDCVTHTGFLWMKENNRSWGVVEQVSHDGNRIMVRVTDREWCARGTEWYYASQWKK